MIIIIMIMKTQGLSFFQH